jgi:transposase-like protein
VQYLNNILEQDHRAIKRRVNAKQGFREFQAARRTIQGYEAVRMTWEKPTRERALGV